MLSFIIPEIVVLYASDGREWDRYLAEEFSQMIEFPLNIHHKQAEHLDEDYDHFHQQIPRYNAFILLISKEFLHTIQLLSHRMYTLTESMNPAKCLIMFCDCLETDVSDGHKRLLCGYRRCHRLVATQTDVKQFMINTVKCLSNILDLNRYKDHRVLNVSKKRYENFISIAPQFELSTDTIHTRNERIYILLESAVSETQRIHVSIGVTNDLLIVHWKNPYTLYFTIPEFMISYNDTLEISLICGHKHLGTRRLKCSQYTASTRPTTPITNRSDEYLSGKSLDTPADQLMDSMVSVNSDSGIDYHKRFELRNNFKEKLFITRNAKRRISCTANQSSRKIYFNSYDYYLIPDVNECHQQTQKILNTRSLDRNEFAMKYSLYDIPRSASLSHIQYRDRQVFV